MSVVKRKLVVYILSLAGLVTVYVESYRKSYK